MIEIAKVIKVEKSSIIVNVTSTSSCSECIMAGHCALNSSSQTLIPRPKDLDVKVGDYVEFETPKNLNATKLSMLLYGIPLIIFIGGTITLINVTKLGNFWSLGISLAGAGIYYWLLSWHSKKHQEKYSPYHVKKVDPPTNVNFESVGDLR
ncbi:SoxR reducing system RseC family protein [Athalassotoga sp.]|uniref:SoxR reducing system RseC family protein n=1 Tax=Athalassotoga sp. TaxID=2022597 RepID=UPI003D094AAD